MFLRSFGRVKTAVVKRGLMSFERVQYQVAIPSRARIRGSFCLVRLLKVFKPVSNPVGVTHFLSLLLHDPRIIALTRSPLVRRRKDLTVFLHML